MGLTHGDATNMQLAYDAYVKFFRWASDRLEGRDGIVCFISNEQFRGWQAFDGMRRELLSRLHAHLPYSTCMAMYARNPKLSGTTHNVFGIQVGVGITVAVRSEAHEDHELHYHRVPNCQMRREEKLAYLAECVASQKGVLGAVDWRKLTQPDAAAHLAARQHADEFARFIAHWDKRRQSRKR